MVLRNDSTAFFVNSVAHRGFLIIPPNMENKLAGQHTTPHPRREQHFETRNHFHPDHGHHRRRLRPEEAAAGFGKNTNQDDQLPKRG